MSDLVGNPEGRFSHDPAQLSVLPLKIYNILSNYARLLGFMKQMKTVAFLKINWIKHYGPMAQAISRAVMSDPRNYVNIKNQRTNGPVNARLISGPRINIQHTNPK